MRDPGQVEQIIGQGRRTINNSQAPSAYVTVFMPKKGGDKL